MIEDTNVTVDEISHEFGDTVARMVELISDPKRLSRRERKRIVNERIRAAIDMHLVNPQANKWVIGAVAVKLSDRIENVRWSLDKAHGDMKMLRMYMNEHEAFMRATHGVCQNLHDMLGKIVGIDGHLTLGMPVAVDARCGKD
mgnify:FL=1